VNRGLPASRENQAVQVNMGKKETEDCKAILVRLASQAYRAHQARLAVLDLQENRATLGHQVLREILDL